MRLIVPAKRTDLAEILQLQYDAFQSEARLYDDFHIPPLVQTMPQLIQEFEHGVFLKAVEGDEIVGSVRAREEGGTLYIAKLIVRPDRQRHGIGKSLLAEIEKVCPHTRCELFTGEKSVKGLCLYAHAGYRVFKKETVSDHLTLIYMEK